MDLRIWVAPLYAMALAGAAILAVVLARRDARQGLQARPFVWAGALGVLLVAVAVRAGWLAATPVSSGSVSLFFGLALVGVAALVALEASRARRRADVLLASPVVPLDDAIEDLRAGRSSGQGVFRGRLECASPLRSPGGLECAYFEAEIRDEAPAGRRGALLGMERSSSGVVEVRGRRRTLRVDLSTARVVAPVQVRRCRAEGKLAFASELLRAEGLELAALSFERAAPIGGGCLLVGRIRPLEDGAYALSGVAGDRPWVVIGDELVALGRRLVARSWGLFAASVGLCAAAAWVLARAG